MAVAFYIGLDRPGDAQHFARACLSIRTLWTRHKPVACPSVLVDSGAFTELLLHGEHRASVKQYATTLLRLHENGVIQIAAAVAQDFMCEPFMLQRTGLDVAAHQRLTIERYDELAAHQLPFPIMPVLQGYQPRDYVSHVEQYGDRLTFGAWVGVGSVCKRNGSPVDVANVLSPIRAARPDLLLHGFGVKRTSLLDPSVRALLSSADSMAWSYAARKQGRNAHDLTEAFQFVEAVSHAPESAWQMSLPLS